VEKVIFIDGFIGEAGGLFSEAGFTVKDLQRELATITDEHTSIVVNINSGGGYVTDGFAMYDLLVAHPLPVHTVVNGEAGSIASVIFQAGKKKGGTRKLYTNSEVFIHNPAWIPNAPEAHEAKDLIKIAADLEKNQSRLINFYVGLTGKSSNVVMEKMSASTTFIGNEAVEFGLADEVISTAINFSKHKYQFNNSNQSIMATIAEQFTAALDAFANKYFNQKTKAVNMVVPLADGAEIFIETEDGDFVGKKVYLMDGGNMTETPAPDGEHALADGRVIVVAEGVVTEVKEAEEDETTALKNQIAELQAKLDAAEKVTNEKETEVVALKSKFSEMQTEFTALKKMVVNVKGDEGAQNFKGEEKPIQKDPLKALAEMRAAKN
jgi:ATP-dependent protease ClpP protease subunit